MDRVLDVNQQPPYVELYSDAPLMCASLVSTAQGMAGRSPAEQVYWCHGVHCTMDDIANSLGLYKVKVISSDTQTCLFTTSPDMSSRQQAEVMLQAAQQLRDVLSQLQMPDGSSVAAKVTIHAGKYAGAVVGRGAWRYDLFGDDVQLLLDMNQATSPNCIQLSDAALNLISSTPGQFTPVCKVEWQGTAHQMHALQQETRSVQTQQSPEQRQDTVHQHQPAAAPSCGPAPSQQPCAQQEVQCAPSQQPKCSQERLQQQQQQQQQPHKTQLMRWLREQHAATGASAAAAQCSKQSPKWHVSRQGSGLTAGPAAAGGHAPTSLGAMQQDLRFTDSAVESVYMQTHGWALLNMDVLFILINAAVMLCSLWDSSSSGGRHPGSNWQVLGAACGHWLLLPVALLWLLTSPRSYSRWREVLWVGHRLVSATNFALLVVLSSLQQRGLLTGAGSGPLGAAAAAAVAAAGPAVVSAALGLHKGSALSLLSGTLGLKVRFYLHMPSCTCACIVVALATLWSYSSSSSSHMDSSGPQGLWGLLQHLLLGWAAPSMLIYLWELEDRLRYVDGVTQQQQCSKGAEHSKCKDV